MKKFIAGLAAGLILATTTFVFAANPIKLIVNGNEIHPDVPPQIIDGRTLVPARALAEALGASVEWDGVENAVVVKSNVELGGTPSDLPAVKSTPQKSANSVVPTENDGLISLRELRNSKGFELSADKTHAVILKKNNVKILVPQPQAWESYTGQTIDGDVVIDGQKSGKIKLKFADTGTLIGIADLESLGLL